ncbi:MAG: hypothetical protein ACN6N7_08960 [Chryseobacterium culicis]
MKTFGEEKIVEEIIEELTTEINKKRNNVLKTASSILKRDVSIQSLHGIIGGKNNTYVDSVRTRFSDFNDFFSNWLKGLNDDFEESRQAYLLRNDEFDWDAKAAFRNVLLLQNEDVYHYTQKFLERNFFKNLNERLRLKPDENLWAIWFGYELSYGLLIAPKMINNSWSTDKSEIRKVKFNYWTIGHIMETGLIDPTLNKPFKFKSLEDLYTFFQSVLKRLSKSEYEQQIFDMYIEYIKSSKDPLNEPFLIPEFRYAGLLKKHEHRLDFTILNQHSVDFIGIEISPASSHMQISNLKQKQSLVNQELKEKWEKEMAKRNKYFDSFGITTKTFTDTNLKDIKQCFEQIKNVLAKRPTDPTSVNDQRLRLHSFDN